MEIGEVLCGRVCEGSVKISHQHILGFEGRCKLLVGRFGDLRVLTLTVFEDRCKLPVGRFGLEGAATLSGI